MAAAAVRPIDPAGFEARFRANEDPWDYRGSRFEAVKRGRLLQACGLRKRGRALELACANGVTSAALAPRCLRLLAVDSSPSALASARRSQRHLSRVRFRQALLPRQMPRGPFDLIVVSELAYYLSPNDLRELARRLVAALAPGGRVLLLHHHVWFDDAAQPPELAQKRLVAMLSGRLAPRRVYRNRRYACQALVKPRVMICSTV